MSPQRIVEWSKKIGIIAGAAIGACTCLAGIGAFVVWLYVTTVVKPAEARTAVLIAAQAEKDNLRYEALGLKMDQVKVGVELMTSIAAEGVYTKKQIDAMKAQRDERSDRIEWRIDAIERHVAAIDASLKKVRLR